MIKIKSNRYGVIHYHAVCSGDKIHENEIYILTMLQRFLY